jgi:hypothetical protein
MQIIINPRTKFSKKPEFELVWSTASPDIDGAAEEMARRERCIREGWAVPGVYRRHSKIRLLGM